MTRTFAYCRVSTSDQTTENQVQEIDAAGFTVAPNRIVSETVSGSVLAAERKGFAQLLHRLEENDVLIVTKLDRLGRNATDVRKTVDHLQTLGVRVVCLALGSMDLTSASGRMTMGVLNAVAEFERDLLIERTQAGLKRAKAQGKTLGRPSSLSPEQERLVREKLAAGEGVRALARAYKVSPTTIQRIERKGIAPLAVDQ